jgi:tetratricopeptide (TPR) repeat protein
LTPNNNAAGARYRLFEAVAASFSAHCASQTILVFEDLHWADRPTLLLLRHLVRHLDLAGVLFVVTYRDDDISGAHLELVQSLAPPALSRFQHIGPFHDGEVRSLVRAIAPPERVQMLVDHASELRDATDGNPFFLRELLREIDDETLKVENEDELLMALSGIAPAGVRALIERRMERLTPLAKEVLCAAATLSDDVSTEVLGDMCRILHDVILETIEECLAARLLVEDRQDFDRFQFPHAMVRNAVYANIVAEERQDLHKRAATSLINHRDGSAHVARIAHHLCQSNPLGLGKEAAEFIHMAAVDAEQHLMFGEAAGWYKQAIAFSEAIGESESTQGRRFLALGRAYANDRQPDETLQALVKAADIARRAGDSGLLVDIALSADGPWSSVSEPRTLALTLLEEALGLLEDGDTARRIRALAGMAAALYYVDHEREGRLALAAVELAGECEDPALIATAQLTHHRWLTHEPKARTERLALTRTACGQIEPHGPTGALFLTLQRELMADLLENGEVGEFRTCLHDYERNAQRLGSPADIYWSMALRATEATLRGDLVTAEQMARGAALRGYEFEQLSDGALLLQRFLIRYQQGRLGEELPVLREVAKADTVFRAGAALMATAVAESGRQESAGNIAWRTLGSDGSELPRDVYWLAAVALFGGVAAQGGDRDLQALLVQLLEPCSDHLVLFGVGGAVLGSGHYWLGLLRAASGDRDSAIDHLRVAVKVAEKIEGPYWVAEAQMAWSRLLANGSDAERQESARLADRSIAIAKNLGFERVTKRSLVSDTRVIS